MTVIDGTCTGFQVFMKACTRMYTHTHTHTHTHTQGMNGHPLMQYKAEKGLQEVLCTLDGSRRSVDEMATRIKLALDRVGRIQKKLLVIYLEYLIVLLLVINKSISQLYNVHVHLHAEWRERNVCSS